MIFVVTYKSRYFPLSGEHKIRVRAPSKKAIRDGWHGIMETDEYRIVKIDLIQK